MLIIMWMQRPQYLVDNGGNIWWVVFVFECVILSKRFTRNVTKWQVTKYWQQKSMIKQLENSEKSTSLIIQDHVMGTPVSEKLVIFT